MKYLRTMRLAMLAPDIVHRILNGDIPKGFTLETLRSPIPDLWSEQRKVYFGEERKKITRTRRPSVTQVAGGFFVSVSLENVLKAVCRTFSQNTPEPGFRGGKLAIRTDMYL